MSTSASTTRPSWRSAGADLKTLLETGQLLTTPGSRRDSQVSQPA